MQWPPRPGPGWNDMKPNGFVAAASITSQTSMSIRSQSCASSLTSAMFTERKMFSSSFDSSAAPAVDLRRRLTRPVGASGIDALRREREVEALSGLQAAALLEDRLHDLARRPGVRRRLEHDELARVEVRSDRARGALHVAEVRLTLRRERRRDGDHDRVRLRDDGVVGRRRHRAGVDEPLQRLGRDVVDVTLAAIDGVHERRDEVDDDDPLPGLRERLRVRQADVAGADDRNVPAHTGDQAYRAAAMRPDAFPSPYRGGRSSGIRASRTASRSASGSSSTSVFAPTSTVSVHSVDGRSVTQGMPYQYASFCRPPESVRTTRACEASAAKSR